MLLNLSDMSLPRRLIDLKFEKKLSTTEYLIANTEFYKVDIHVSHNATFIKGFELMTHNDLVTMFPADITDSNITKINNWKIHSNN